MAAANTDAKTWYVLFGPNNSTADTQLCSENSSGSILATYANMSFSNQNATNSQVVASSTTSCAQTITTTTLVTASVDTTATTYVGFYGKLGTTTDTIGVRQFIVEYLPIGGH
jgi:hypothetical protein